MQPYSLMKDTSPAIRSDGQNRRFTRSHLLLLKRMISDQMTAVKEMAILRGQRGIWGEFAPQRQRRASDEYAGCSFAYVAQYTQCNGIGRIIAPSLNDGFHFFD